MFIYLLRNYILLSMHVVAWLTFETVLQNSIIKFMLCAIIKFIVNVIPAAFRLIQKTSLIPSILKIQDFFF